jgi:hypothetical protein
MTAPLHHINQMILHLPAINGQVAGQVAALDEAMRLERQIQAREIHRDTVVVVSALKDSVAVTPVHPDPEKPRKPGFFASFRSRKPKKGREEARIPLGPIEPVVDLRV